MPLILYDELGWLSRGSN